MIDPFQAGNRMKAFVLPAHGQSLDTSMTELGYHFLIHFNRLTPENGSRTELRGSLDAGRLRGPYTLFNKCLGDL